MDKVSAYFSGTTKTHTETSEWVGISVTSTNSGVFTVHLVDSYFKNAHSNYLTWFDHIESKQYDAYLYGPKTTLKTQLGLNFHSLVFDWSPTSDNMSYLYTNIMRPTAGNLLGLANDWKQDPSGTQNDNNGFDMLFAHRYRLNTDGTGGGMMINEWNQAILMKGYYLPIGYRLMDQTLGTIHESLHTFYCSDIFSYIRYIMSHYFADYVMHSQTLNEIDLTVYAGFG